MLTFDNYAEPKYSINAGKGVMIGSTEVMVNLFHYLNSLAGLPTTVLLRGETGTGKELCARALHYNANGTVNRTNFVAVNCAGIPPELLESELFGYVKGSFTGAYRDTVGKFQHAHKGTILLDEIGDMSLSLQAKILRVLQERQVTRVGSAETENVDVRVIAATNRNLEELVKNGKFREDLYYRINVLPITIPPLRERTGDIPLIAAHLIKKYNKVYGANIEGLSFAAAENLKSAEWKGNIRELENVIERVFVLQKEGIVKAEDLSFDIHQIPPPRIIDADRGKKKGYEAATDDKSIIEEPTPEAGTGKAWYENGVLPVVGISYLCRLAGSRYTRTIRGILNEGSIYVERVNPDKQLRFHIIYLTPHNVSLFFRDKGTRDYQTLEQEIRNGKFNTLVHSPFKFFSSIDIIPSNKYITFLRAVKWAAEKAQVYRAPSLKNYYYALTEDNVDEVMGMVFGHSETERNAKIEQMKEEIRRSYESFKTWKPAQGNSS